MGGTYEDLQSKVDLWTGRAIDAVQKKDVINQDFAINIAKGYAMKLAEIYDKPVFEEEGRWIDCEA